MICPVSPPPVWGRNTPSGLPSSSRSVMPGSNLPGITDLFAMGFAMGFAVSPGGAQRSGAAAARSTCPGLRTHARGVLQRVGRFAGAASGKLRRRLAMSQSEPRDCPWTASAGRSRFRIQRSRRGRPARPGHKSKGRPAKLARIAASGRQRRLAELKAGPLERRPGAPSSRRHAGDVLEVSAIDRL